MTSPSHRIFLVPIRPELDPLAAHEHWTGRHSMIFGRNPGLLGYVQNRPPSADWAARTHICAEAWFADRDAERAAFRSSYYLDHVVPDEDRFVQREDAWHSPVDVVRSAAVTHSFRVLVFGHSTDSAAGALEQWAPDAVDAYTVARPMPIGGRRSILGLWTDDEQQARDAAVRFGPLAWLTRPEPVVPPPHAPWNGVLS